MRKIRNTADPRFFYTVGYRLAQAYGLREQPRDPKHPERLAWFASTAASEEILVFANAIIIRAEDGTMHRLAIVK